MADQLQPVEAGGILDALIKRLFGGLDNILNAAAEYEEEMGVLKQVNRIVIHPENDPNKSYVLKISLSPVRDKVNIYYVEAETNAPGFDVSSINNKVMKLDNSSMKDFKKMIENLISANNLEAAPAEEQAEAKGESEEETEEGEEQYELTEDDVQTIGDVILAARDYLTENPISDRPEYKYIGYDVFADLNINKKDPTICDIIFYVKDASGNHLKEYDAPATVSTVDADGYPLSQEGFIEDLDEEIKAYIDANKDFNLNASTKLKIDATFIKASTNNEVSLTAINTNCDITAAWDIIDEIADIDEFVDGLGEDPKSFSIEENDDGYTIEEIEEVDTSSTYDKLFEAACSLSEVLRAYRWAIGYRNWYQHPSLDCANSCIETIVDTTAFWVLENTDHYALPCLTLPIEPTLEEVRDSSGEISIDLMQDVVKSMLETFIDILDGFYINLSHDEQAQVDEWIAELKRQVAYS